MASLVALLAASGPRQVHGRTVNGSWAGSDYACTIRDSDNALVSCDGDYGDYGLDINDNAISTWLAGAFTGLPALTELILESNAISTLQAGMFTGLSALTLLDLACNTISTLQAGVFSGLPALTQLALEDNAMSMLQAGVFTGLSALMRLDLAGNAMSTLQAGVFSGLSALTELQLEGNPFTSFPCDWGVNTAVTSVTFPTSVSMANCVVPTAAPTTATPTTLSPTASPTTPAPTRSPTTSSPTTSSPTTPSPTASPTTSPTATDDTLLYIKIGGGGAAGLVLLAAVFGCSYYLTPAKRPSVSGNAYTAGSYYEDDDIELELIPF